MVLSWRLKASVISSATTDAVPVAAPCDLAGLGQLGCWLDVDKRSRKAASKGGPFADHTDDPKLRRIAVEDLLDNRQTETASTPVT